MESKRHYKMYKNGKSWTFAAITTLFVGYGLLVPTTTGSAATSTTNQSTSGSTTQSVTTKPAAQPTSQALKSNQISSASQSSADQGTTTNVKHEQASQNNHTKTSATATISTQTNQNSNNDTVSSATITAKSATISNTDLKNSSTSTANEPKPVTTQAVKETTHAGKESLNTNAYSLAHNQGQTVSNGTVTQPTSQVYTEEKNTVHETINYVDKHGNPVATAHQADPITFVLVTNILTGNNNTYCSQTTDTIKIDQNTGKPEGNEWYLADSEDFLAVTNPVISGYKVTSNDAPKSDLTTVAAQTVTKGSHDLTYTVVYKPLNECTQESYTVNETIKYVDENGVPIATDYHAHPLTFILLTNLTSGDHNVYYSNTATTMTVDPATGKPAGNEWQLAGTGDTAEFAAVTNPQVNGYKVLSNDAPNSDLSAVAKQSVSKIDKDLVYTVVYTKQADEYTQTQHTLHETINYVDKQGNIMAPTYHAQPVTFITVTNKTTGAKQTYYSTIATTMTIDPATGKPVGTDWHIGNQTDFIAVTNPTITGYHVISNDAPKSDLSSVAAQAITENGHDLTYTVVYDKPDETKYTQESHIVNETINYIDSQGQIVAPAYHAQPVTFITVTNKTTGAKQTYYSTTATTMTIDPATGKPVGNDWQLANQANFAAVVNPQLTGYQVIKTDAPNSDLQTVALQTVTNQNGNLIYTVVYAKSTTPTEPLGPTTPTKPILPTEPGQPVEPTLPVAPDKPVEPITPVQPGTVVEPASPMTSVRPSYPVSSDHSTNNALVVRPTSQLNQNVPTTPVHTDKQLPQTAETTQHSAWLSLIGLLTMMLTLGLGAKWWRH